MIRRATKPNADWVDAAGSTLVEVLVAVVLMGLAIIVMITGMSTLFISSIQNRETTTAGVVARSYAEALIATVAQTATTDAWCNTTGYATSYTPPAGYTVASAFPLGCPVSTAETTPQLEYVVITATAPLGRSETLRIVVRPT